MSSKYDIKTIAIVILLGVCCLFFGMWYFKGDDTKNRIKDLEAENKKIEKVRDSLDKASRSLQIEFDKRQKDINSRDGKIKEIETQLSKTKQDLTAANAKVRDSQRELEETKKKVSDLEKNPIKRDGDDLINSLKEKLK